MITLRIYFNNNSRLISSSFKVFSLINTFLFLIFTIRYFTFTKNKIPKNYTSENHIAECTTRLYFRSFLIKVYSETAKILPGRLFQVVFLKLYLT
jgi:hypothetical protein